MFTPNTYAEFINGDWQEKVFKIWTEYEKLMKEIGALDFDDLLLKTVNLFDEDQQVLVEWQDTNKVQYKLTKQLVGLNENLTAVGDAAQSIYSWRGADYRNINYLMQD